MSDWLGLTDKKIIVTGGSSGIGLAIVQELLEQGAYVINADLKAGSFTHENLQFVPTNISSKIEVDTLVTAALNNWNTIDALVNNAGINLPALMVDMQQKKYEMTEEQFDRMVAINQKGVFLTSQAVSRILMDKGAGVVINISSECGLEGSEGQSVYAATKAAINSFTRSWAKEWGRYGVRVVGVAPGIMEATGLRTFEYERSLAYTRNLTVEQLREGYGNVKTIPLGRSGKLTEVSDFVCYLISDRASYISGVTINIAGGKTRG
ncbi:SDR family NAD(P)-dependent oxidoreductase [Enterococcus avium]|uniref:SDR family oxidoreductase n=1 Tax=Enterococcus avium TaxID=33945 RepID=UPI00159DD965|nr:SDR family oxidoreductase [Enterococcus avium]NVN75898.1 SDR family NAD(P)-dependent oxidoreductase [Enterococcus avium]